MAWLWSELETRLGRSDIEALRAGYRARVTARQRALKRRKLPSEIDRLEVRYRLAVAKGQTKAAASWTTKLARRRALLAQLETEEVCS
jgi:hypothetical protein